MKKNKSLTSLDQFVDKEFGKKGTKKIKKFDAVYENLEKDLKDVRFSALSRIIREGLGARLEISIIFPINQHDHLSIPRRN